MCSQFESLNTKIRDPALNESAKLDVVCELILHKSRAKRFYTELNAAKEKYKDENSRFMF